MGTKWNVDSNGNLKLAGTIEDNSSLESIDINNRKLYANNGTTYNIDYSIPGTVNFNGANLTNVGSITPILPIAPTWNNITSASVSMIINNNYSLNYTTSVNATLPSTSAYGSEIKICDLSGNGFSVKQPAGVYIITLEGQTTTGTSGSITTSEPNQSIYLVCLIANTAWQVVSSEGVFNVI